MILSKIICSMDFLYFSDTAGIFFNGPGGWLISTKNFVSLCLYSLDLSYFPNFKSLLLPYSKYFVDTRTIGWNLRFRLCQNVFWQWWLTIDNISLFQLNNPTGGWRKKTIHYVEGGDFGNREDKINKLLRKMV